MSDGVLLARVGVSIGITASYSGAGCTIGISITFSVDLYFISNISSSSYKRVENIETQKVKTNKEILSENKETLEKLYDIWAKYIDRYQSDQSLKIIKNQQELNDEILKVGKEQYRIRALIENVIYGIDEFLTNKKLNESEIKQCYILLSTAYQLIRDLSLTFCLGEMSLRSSVDCSERAEEISKKWLAKDDNIDVISLIKLRRDYSREIEKLTNTMVDNNNDYVECTRREAEIKGNIDDLMDKYNRVQKSISIIDNLDESESEISHLTNTIEKKNSRLQKYMDDRNEVQKNISGLGLFGHSKKKNLENRLKEIELTIDSLKAEIERNKIQLEEVKNKLGNNDIKGSDEIDKKIKGLKDELTYITNQKIKFENTVNDSSKEIDNLMIKYKNVVEKIVKMEV